MNIKQIMPAPTANRVLIKQSEVKAEIGGLMIPETAMKKPRRGKVVATSEYYNCPTNGKVEPLIKVDDEVMYEDHTGVEVDIEGEDFILLQEPHIFVVL